MYGGIRLTTERYRKRNNKCVKCYYWSISESSKFGEGKCMRYPPKYIRITTLTNDIIYKWDVPRTRDIDYCGEWREE